MLKIFILFFQESSVKKLSEIVGTMSKISNKTTLEDLKQGLNGVIGTIGNSLIVRFLFLYNRSRDEFFGLFQN